MRMESAESLTWGISRARGVFKAWEVPGYFNTVRVTEYGSIAWGEVDDIELCP